MPVPPSGRQLDLTFDGQHATIVEVGGGVREYNVHDRPVLEPYPLEAMCDGAHGTPLIPWPNRLENGAYSFEGINYQVAITEPSKNNAIHGFTRWRQWQIIDHSKSAAVVGTRIYPMTGYPFALEITITYSLDENGLTVTTKADNIGDSPCPYGSGQHPYLSPGSGLIDDCTLILKASTRILTDNEQQLPTGTEEVAGTQFDFNVGRLLGDTKLDYPFTGLERDETGRAWVKLIGSDGKSAEIWVDRNYRFLEIYTGDTLSKTRRRRGLGTEPMTCPPNAFASGDSLIRLAPGESIVSEWGCRLRNSS